MVFFFCLCQEFKIVYIWFTISIQYNIIITSIHLTCEFVEFTENNLCLNTLPYRNKNNYYCIQQQKIDFLYNNISDPICKIHKLYTFFILHVIYMHNTLFSIFYWPIYFDNSHYTCILASININNSLNHILYIYIHIMYTL